MREDKKYKGEAEMSMYGMPQESLMQQMPGMPHAPAMCCPFLMNKQCPLMYGYGMAGMSSMMGQPGMNHSNMSYPYVNYPNMSYHYMNCPCTDHPYMSTPPMINP